MTIIANIYVGITGHLIQVNNIHLCKEKIQHSMLDHTDFNDISTDTYK